MKERLGELEIYKQGRTGLKPSQESLTRREDRMNDGNNHFSNITQSLESYRDLLERAHVPNGDIERLCKSMTESPESLINLAVIGVIEENHNPDS